MQKRFDDLPVWCAARARFDALLDEETPIGVYVDDDESSCVNDQNPDGPSPPYTCVGGDHAFAP